MAFSFEIKERDLLGRIGRLKTKGGVFETPVLLPVINPKVQPISPKIMWKELGCKALITNAYIIRKQFGNIAVQKEVKKLLDFDGVVMTDSGAYQILEYGEVETTPEEIVHFQEAINADIATILDIPTGWHVTRDYAKHTVTETCKRAKQLFKIKTRNDMAWVGPVQGGQHLDMVANSAKAMGKLPFQIHALGSPTKVMEQYFFDVLQDMILTAKMNLPPERPLHLFGAGHPIMFCFAVALGCDLFDSASYALYARENRYMTEYGTLRLEELEYFPCSCPVCRKHAPQDVALMLEEERRRLLAFHNLHVCFAEIKRVKQAIVEGRLWEHLEMRAHTHPSLLQALKKLSKYSDFVEAQSPVTKPSGIFFFSSVGLARPEIARHGKRLSERYSPPAKAKVLVLIPQPRAKPLRNAFEYRRLCKILCRKLGEERLGLVHLCVYGAPFGVVPVELDEVYPLSQNEVANPLDLETIGYVAEQVAGYLEQTRYQKVLLVKNAEALGRKVVHAFRKVCRRNGLSCEVFSVRNKLGDEELDALAKVLEETLDGLGNA